MLANLLSPNLTIKPHQSQDSVLHNIFPSTKHPSSTEKRRKLMDIWSWITELPNSAEWPESDSPLIFTLATKENTNQAIQLRAHLTSASNSDAIVNFSLCFQGFELSNGKKETVWVSDACPLSADKPFLPLLLQLIQDIITRSPTAYDRTCPRSQLQKLKPGPISWIMDSHSPESFSSFFNLVFLTRLFWLCVCDVPSEVGSMFFNLILGPNLEEFTCNHAPLLRNFFLTVGVDAELCFMRTLGYMLAKWLILKEVGIGSQASPPDPPRQRLGFSYATEANGYWILKGYAPVFNMKVTRSNGKTDKFPVMEPKESVLRYALAHQQLEAVIQLEYFVGFYDGHIQVNARVDNLRFHVIKLGFNEDDDDDKEFAEEKHFPSRIRVWVGPEIGSNYVGGLSLGRSTHNEEREVETQRTVKGNFGKSKLPGVKARAKMSSKTKNKNWRWDQDVEGNAAVFDAVLCDNVTGQEIMTSSNENLNNYNNDGMKNRYRGGSRLFTKGGGLVFAGDEYGEGVGWRLSREMEGSVLKWRIGGKFWLSYWGNNVKTQYCETRCVEWCDEVDLPLIPGKY